MVKMLDPKDEISDLNNTTIGEFWAWAYSDILLNVNRGIFAEFLVANRLGIDVRKYPRTVYDYIDIRYRGKTIEVKCSAYVQSWDLLDFSWDKIKENDSGSDNRRLYEFLKLYYNIDWEKTAKIKKEKDGTIKLSTETNSTETNSISLSLNDDKTKFILKFKGRTDTFKYKEPNQKKPEKRFDIRIRGVDDSCKFIPKCKGERLSDCYVFCLYDEMDVTKANVMEISKWKFYVKRTSDISRDKKSISISDLGNHVEYANLQKAIDSVLEL
jgi:excinuclease UvrABC ATPase subunit